MRKLGIFGLLASCLPAFAWGPEGHDLVARIAEAELTPAVRARVAEILGPGQTIVSVSSWADRVRNQRPETGPWHYIDIPITQPHLDIARDCPKGDCVIRKIEDFEAVLKDPATPPEKRREALMFIIHFVGDLHQPLHCSDNKDRGGNDVHISFNGHNGNLHSLWDSGLLGRIGTEDALFPKLSADAAKHRKKWAKGTVESWAEESHKDAQKIVYGKLPKPSKAPAHAAALANPAPAAPLAISAAYEKKADPLIAEQLEKAGVRLAYVLNSTLQ